MDEERDAPLAETRAAPRPAPASPGRHGGATLAVGRSAIGEPGLGLLLASVALIAVVAVAVVVGWVALLFVVAVIQVFLARTWVEYLEVPGSVQVAVGVLGVAVVADLGVVVAHLRAGPYESADELVQLAPALGVVFLAAVLAQLVRRDGRDGVLAGLVAASTGGLLAVGLAVWLPVQASLAGGHYVVIGVGACAAAGVVVGVVGWVRHVDVPPPALLLPVLLGLAAGPVYVLGRVVAG